MQGQLTARAPSLLPMCLRPLGMLYRYITDRRLNTGAHSPASENRTQDQGPVDLVSGGGALAGLLVISSMYVPHMAETVSLLSGDLVTSRGLASYHHDPGGFHFSSSLKHGKHSTLVLLLLCWPLSVPWHNCSLSNVNILAASLGAIVLSLGGVCWHNPVIPAQGKQWWVDLCEFGASLVYTVSSRSADYIGKLCL